MKIDKIAAYNFSNNIRKDIGKKEANKGSNETNLAYMPHYPLISFGAKSSAEKLSYIGEENFPNPEILKRYKASIEEGGETLLCDIHKEFYSKLLECKTLDEAKDKYPEFAGVIDAKNMPYEEYTPSMKKIADGEIEGIDVESLSLTLLQKHYAMAHGYAKKEEYFGFQPQSVQKMFERLNIKLLNREYFITISRETPERRAVCSENSKKNWQNQDYREGRVQDAKKRWTRAEYREKRGKTIREYWADPERREAQAQNMRKMHESEDFEKRRIAGIRKAWADPNKREHLEEIQRQCLEARWADPAAHERAREIMLQRWQDPEYREKICKGISERMKARWQDPRYIEFKTQEKLQAWSDPVFRQYMSDTMREKWQDPEYREKMAVYSEALSLAWKEHPEISAKMSEIAEEFPGLGRILTKKQKGIPLDEKEEIIMSAYYKKCHEEMPNFTWIVGQTQKEILRIWEEEKNKNNQE